MIKAQQRTTKITNKRLAKNELIHRLEYQPKTNKSNNKDLEG